MDDEGINTVGGIRCMAVAVHDRQDSGQVSVGSVEGTWLEWRQNPKHQTIGAASTVETPVKMLDCQE
jgi:hypothetical protein